MTQQQLASDLTIRKPKPHRVGPESGGSAHVEPDIIDVQAEDVRVTKPLSAEDEFIIWCANHLISVMEIVPTTPGRVGQLCVKYIGDIPPDKVIDQMKKLNGGLVPWLINMEQLPNRRSTDPDPIIMADTDEAQASA